MRRSKVHSMEWWGWPRNTRSDNNYIVHGFWLVLRPQVPLHYQPTMKIACTSTVIVPTPIHTDGGMEEWEAPLPKRLVEGGSRQLVKQTTTCIRNNLKGLETLELNTGSNMIWRRRRDAYGGGKWYCETLAITEILNLIPCQPPSRSISQFDRMRLFFVN